jgi:hypothetical protein
MCAGSMAIRCPTAVAVGRARLDGWRFTIFDAGFATIVPAPGCAVHGVLWRISASDLAALNRYEGVDVGLYARRFLPVRCGGVPTAALVYVARSCRSGRPRPAYMALIAAAAFDWEIPDEYVRFLKRLAPGRPSGARPRETGEIV